MWFMSYVKNKTGNYKATCNCVVDKHPVLVIKEWNEQQNNEGYYFVVLFYDKLPDDVAEQGKNFDVGLYEYH